MSASPPISVLLPVRNGVEYLPEAIASIEAQTYSNYEVVAVDDGSSDDSWFVLQDWASRDERVRVFRQEPKGIVPALEFARSEATGAYLARMDADDIADPTRFDLQIQLMQSDSSLAICGCEIEYFPAEKVRDGALRYQSWLNAPARPEEIEKEIFVECPLPHPAFFMRADAIEQVGGYQDLGWPEDYDLLLRVWRSGGRLGKVPAVLMQWREAPERLSRIDKRYSLDAFRRCKVHHLISAFPSAVNGVLIWGAGRVGKGFSRELAQVGVPVIAYAEVSPRKIGQNIHGAPVLDADEALRLKDVLHLASVGQEGARQSLRNLLSKAGYRELENFVAMA
ncbi:MAG: glycosyl transferase [Gemmatimonadetes bacterium]|nr:glycosyl transferase [Gemmatimonadota bacterium]|tara:strand:- start:544 stop:1557 length:1014 start_codon:yes stop_codon:yes gene_type:complete